MKKILSLLALTALTIGLLGSCKKEEPKVSVTGISLDKTELTITVGDPDAQLTATVAPENATEKSVNWASDKAEVATVDNQGSVHAVAPGEAIITVTTTDGGKTATCTVTVKAALPTDALSGEFSVSGTKKVRFSKGNLWADGSNALHFESNQYSSASSWDASHVSHFTWSSTVEAAVGDSNSGDNLFCDESHKVSVDGGDAIYYALSKDEWSYLFNNRKDAASKVGYATVGGVNGIIILPDNFTDPMKNNGNGAFVPKSSTGWDKNVYTSGDNWNAMESAGAVFLPAAGGRCASDVYDVGDYGIYWSSTASDSGLAYMVSFYRINVSPEDSDSRNHGYSVRLITDVK